MPSSLLALAPRIIALADDRARELGRPIRVLDVGVGRGKYGLLLREYLGDRLAALDGIEAEARYLDQAPWVRSIYDIVLVDDVTNLSGAAFGLYDLVLMVDVFEHIDRDAGAELLRRIEPPVVISTPRDYFQNPEHLDYPSEDHRSHWSAADLAEVRPLDREDTEALDVYAAVLVRLAPLR